jgi:hypothetical protein
MNICLFVTFRSGANPPSDEMTRLDAMLRATPKLARALVHTSSSASDPYIKDGAPPQLVLQLYFPTLHDAEAALTRLGRLGDLMSSHAFPALSAADVSHQVMVARTFAVPDPRLDHALGTPYCTYLVSYEGEAEDINVWLAHYLDLHTEHMARFPGIRELEVYTRLDWVSRMPWARSNFMQRNKVAFDSPEALTHALHSPVRHAMRADYNTFPPFTGPTRHFAMTTRVVRPHP